MGTYLSTPVTEKHYENGESFEYVSTTTTTTHKPHSVSHIVNQQVNETTDSITTLKTTKQKQLRKMKAICHVAWGVVDMQGWRKSMEDAHVAQTNVPFYGLVAANDGAHTDTDTDTCSTVTTTTTTHATQHPEPSVLDQNDETGVAVDEISAAHVFAIFDGHGGAEVARFTAMYIVSVLQQQIHALVVQFQSESALGPSSSSSERILDQCMGTALIDTFHALDRMVDDPQRHDELMKLRVLSPPPSEQRIAHYIPPPPPSLTTTTTTTIHTTPSNNIVSPPETMDISAVANQQSLSSSSSTIGSDVQNSNVGEIIGSPVESSLCAPETVVAIPTLVLPAENSVSDGADCEIASPNHLAETNPDDDHDINDDDNDADSLDIPKKGMGEASDLDQDISSSSSSSEDGDTDEGIFVEATNVIIPVHADTSNIPEHDNPAVSDNKDDDAFTASIETALDEVDTATTITTQTSFDSIPISGATSSSMPPTPVVVPVTTTSSLSSVSKVTGILQRLLKFNGPSGQVVLQVGTAAATANNATKATNNNPQVQSGSRTVSSYSSSTNMIDNNVMGVPFTISPPSIVRNGQLMCNLADHPIHAGATAIAAVLVGRTLTVANAGDSRAVLCRGTTTNTSRSDDDHPYHHQRSSSRTTNPSSFSNYQTIALSLDHKPMNPEELYRIVNAGGFVNSFGRINGNLNLSRSIGDLKYKQVSHLPMAQQIITAEPDIVQLRILYIYMYIKLYTYVETMPNNFGWMLECFC
jgi:serine/threonine protein phosphatase PrpC